MYEYALRELERAGVSRRRVSPVVSVARTTVPVQEAAAPTSDVLFLGFCLAVLQLADGVLTSIGVSRYGLAIEGNPILRVLMSQFGHVPTLAILKIFALGIVVTLTYLAHKLPWVRSAMGALTCVYFFAAIIPWTYLLFIKPYI